MQEQRKRIRRLSIWFLVNSIIFVACYLNYRLQLKHRYLYRTLNVGLCFSRAAAMVINFNLLLVWLPMCKYSLTRFAYLANGSTRHLKQILHNHHHQSQLLEPPAAGTIAAYVPMVAHQNHHSKRQKQLQPQDQPRKGPIITIDMADGSVKTNDRPPGGSGESQGNCSFSSRRFHLLMSKVKSAANGAIWQLQDWFYCAKLNSISSFLVAVDHCISLHTICATTITIASVIHTVAHLMNVINFSNNYDPLLSNLNMAEFRGQNPFQLLVSVPGITGILMVIILILMSLSSVGCIRNSSYDLFQIFHRLSVIFVILLFLHPSSHVLKEQSNVDRHNPELCYDNLASINSTRIIFKPESNSIAAAGASASQRITIRTRAPPPGNVTQLLPNKILPASSEQNENHHHSNDYNQGRQFNSSATRRLQYYAGQSKPSLNSNNNNNHYIHKTTKDLNNNNNNSNNNNINIKKSNQNETTIIQERANVPPPPPMDSGSSNNNNNNNSTNGYYYNYPQLNQNNHNNKTTARREIEHTVITNNLVRNTDITYDDDGGGDDDGLSSSSSPSGGIGSNKFCLDPRPLFVAQSSICWYVLSVGLSCYLVDLILRKSRRSKSSIELLNARLDCEGNLIELILNSNHKRFALWLPGQFVYLNCPQIATFEWHPFTISSMDNRSGQFTLHIKTGGDWTRKLRKKLESMQHPMLPNSNNQDKQQLDSSHDHQQQKQRHVTCKMMEPETREIFFKSNPLRPLHVPPVLPDFDCYNKTGKLQVECTKVVCIRNNDEIEQQHHYDNCWFEIEKSSDNHHHHHHQEPYSICRNNNKSIMGRESGGGGGGVAGLELYIDGPFHSPFERLLEQQVSVCIANGVGWTAFSSVFQCLSKNFLIKSGEGTADSVAGGGGGCWWSQWHNFATNNRSAASNTQTQISGQQTSVTAAAALSSNLKKLSDTKLHLMVIVTSIEQLKPFYELAIKYFNRIQNERQISVGDQLNPVREITAFLTRSTKDDHNVKEFCQQENLSLLHDSDNNIIRVNDLFTIHFGKPKFGFYFSELSAIYTNYKKISVYCCGSYQVKRDVREICLNLNKATKFQSKLGDKTLRPIYSYHEENF